MPCLALRRQFEGAGKHVGVPRDEVAIELALDPEPLGDALLLLRRAQIAAGPLKRGDGLVIDRVDDDDRVLGRAGGRVVEDLRVADFDRRLVEVGGLIDDDRDVAGADANRGRAAGVGPADVVLRARDTTRSQAFIMASVESFVTGSGRICTRSAGKPTRSSSCRIRSTMRAVVR